MNNENWKVLVKSVLLAERFSAHAGLSETSKLYIFKAILLMNRDITDEMLLNYSNVLSIICPHGLLHKGWKSEIATLGKFECVRNHFIHWRTRLCRKQKNKEAKLAVFLKWRR